MRYFITGATRIIGWNYRSGEVHENEVDYEVRFRKKLLGSGCGPPGGLVEIAIDPGLLQLADQ